MRGSSAPLLVFVSTLLFVSAGCGGKSKSVSKGDVKPADSGIPTPDVAGEIHFKPTDIVADQGLDLPEPDLPKDLAETAGDTDVALFDAADIQPDTWTPVSCISHEDCDDGFCIEVSPGAGQYVCAPHCIEECPLDWECKSVYVVGGPDPVSLCVPPSDTLCGACKKDIDCLFSGSLCIKGGGTLGFCGKLCNLDDQDCPLGFECAIAKNTDGEDMAPQCMPPAGFCCASGKLTSCDDSNPCTADFCDASFGCQHDPVEGLCEGPEPCTNYVCMNGTCLGVPVTEDVTLDGIDDDCDGLTDEDWVLGLNVPFHTFAGSLGTISGGGITIRGAVSTPPTATVMSGDNFKVTPVTTKVVVPEEEE